MSSSASGDIEMEGIPVVDIGCVEDKLGQVDWCGAGVKQVAQELHQAFSNIGFVYLRNHGIHRQQVDDVMTISDRFFTLPTQTKQRYARQDDANYGWVCMEREILNPERPGDMKEAYDVSPRMTNPKRWPDDAVPGFQDCVLDFYNNCFKLSDKVLKLMAIGLQLPDKDFFSKYHATSASTLRCLYYPPIPESAEVKPNQVRCGEHSDYGSISLLFQDGVGGLEVQTREGQYVPATPEPDTVLVNIADLMQRWTADQLVSTKHRVLVPEAELRQKLVRRSLAFFVQPDHDCIVTCIDGSDKYPPINSLDYLNMRLGLTY